MVKYNNDILTKHKIARQFKYIMANKLTIYSVVDDTDHTKDAFKSRNWPARPWPDQSF